ncbi:MAG: type VI secretion system amidase effector protein Tae4 [Gammaproteobacteria bacterium]|nr:type VI secretion system amidase effector protein Tae4 [Gammaproteobacteria bacterium]
MVTFQKLWENHPTITGDDNPCKTNGKSNYPNQCAIRVGVSLAKSGVNTSRIPGAEHCWHKHDKSLGHIIRAEELAKGLEKYSVFIHGFQKVQKVNAEEFKNTLRGKRGIIFFKDYYQRTNNGKKESFRNRSGDHIDLWNGSRLTDWFTWVRIQAGFSWEGSFSDFGKSREIWFWRVL